MRKALLMAGALLALTSTLAFAAGSELAWNHCFGQTGAVATRTSACTQTTGAQAIYASFRPPPGVNQLEGAEVFIDYQIRGGLQCWWNYALGQTRNANLTTLPLAPTDANGVPTVLCEDYYFSRGSSPGGGGGMIQRAADRGQLRGLVAVQAQTGGPVPAEVQQYGVGFRFTNQQTPTTCPGCTSPGCFVLSLINLFQPGQPDVQLRTAHPGSQNFVTWQLGPGPEPGGSNCPAACHSCPPTPALKSTWGSIKALYR